MFPYIILAFSPIIMGELFGRTNDGLDNRKSKLGYGTFCIILILLLSLRGETVGADTGTYEKVFDRISNETYDKIRTDEIIEVGFAYLMKICSEITGYQGFLAILAIITVVPLGFFFYKESKNYILVLALFLVCSHFNMLFTGLRQIVAITFCIPAYYFTKNKKLIPFLITAALALLFHNSAFVIFFIYPIYHIRLKAVGLLGFVPFIAAIFAFNDRIFVFLTQFLNDEYATKYGEVEQTGAYTMILLYAIFVVFAFVIPDESKMDKNAYGLRNMLVMCLVFQLFAPVNYVAMRMNFYFMFYIPIALPKLIDLASDNYKTVARLANQVLCVFFIFYSFFAIYRTHVDGGLYLYPYKFMWQ